MSKNSATRANDFRDYLLLLARLQTDRVWRGKADLSGVVQQTIYEASLAPEAPAADQEYLAWIRRLLSNNLRDELRKCGAERRDARREVRLETGLDASSARLERMLVDKRSRAATPSARIIRAEELAAIAKALCQLSEDQQTAIERHHLQGKTLAEIAAEMNRSKEAIASLLYRGLTRLRRELAPIDS